MKLIKILYEKGTGKSAPYYYDYDLWTIIKKPIRKWITNSVAYNCPFNTVRIALYKLCGVQIGRNAFIGMHCYFDDMCFEYLEIGSDCVISYGVYFACHGWEQENQPIVVKDGAYTGMRSIIIGKNGDIRGGVVIGEKAAIGAGTLVNRNIPDGCRAGGVPSRILGKED